MSNVNGFHTVKRAVFLDRDGTLNVEKDYLFRPDECELIPGAIEAIQRLNNTGWLVVVITNQSGVARGYYEETDVHLLHQHIDSELRRSGAWVDGWYYCPHHPSGREPYNRECSCRKPLPGMLEQAAAEHTVELANSWMVGDKLVDIEAGRAAGCRSILVRTGYGVEAENKLPEDVLVCDNLLDAVRHITAV